MDGRQSYPFMDTREYPGEEKKKDSLKRKPEPAEPASPSRKSNQSTANGLRIGII
jgi:hypothetical protein